jgi:hypothetical protein
MARNPTPDVLGELLAGPADIPAQTPTPAAVAPAPSKPRPARTAKKPDAKPAARPEAAPAVVRWDYLVISFGDYRGWRPRFINGQEIRNWMHAPVIHDYISQLGEDGWELVGAGGGKALYGSSDYYQLFFKRQKR